jgi:polysaccharide deacetylase family protein (PEP-CTERM system associated)
MLAEIVTAGHEIASHGYSHRMVTGLTPKEFRDELKRTNDILGSHSGCLPRGFRAPQWSLSKDKTPWAFDILLEEGFVYDSSCTPLPFVGNRSGSRFPYRMKLPGGTLWEIPPMVSQSVAGNLPTGGGWGFRFFPLGMIERTILSLNAVGHPAVLFLHPREIDPQGPRLPLSRFRSFVSYGPRTDAMDRLSGILQRFRFIPLQEMVGQWESA